MGRFGAVFWGGSNFFGHWTLGGSPQINFNFGLFHFLAIFGHFLAVFASAWPSIVCRVVLSDFVLLSTYLYLKPGLGGF